MFAIYTFYISFAGIILLLAFKMIEQYVGGLSWWNSFVSRADSKVHAWRDALQAKFRLWKKIAYLFIFEFLPSYAYKQAVKLKDYLYKRYYESSERFKGEKRMLKSNGTVSEFLQNITKDDTVME